MIKILLVEDHHIVRDGLRFILEQEPDIQVILEAADGQEGLDHLGNGHKPDLILTSMNMPGPDVMAIIKAFTKDHFVLVLSMVDHEQYVSETLNAGAHGYLLKSVSKKEMLFAVRYVADGGMYICSDISFKLLDRLTRINGARPNGKLNFELTEREQKVLTLIGDGYTNKEMADKLFSSRRTIEGHRQSLMNKTGSKNTATLIKFAVQNGLV